MHQTFRLTMATALLALVTSSAFAATTPPSAGPASTGDPIVSSQGDIASPGDPFFPETSRGPKPGRSPMPQLECWVAVNEEGIVEIYIKNLTGKFLEPYTEIQVVMGNGEKFSSDPWAGWQPGQIYTWSDGSYDGPLTCTATIEPEEDDVPR